MKKHHADKLIKASTVTNSLTKAQLKLEIMIRNPGIKRLSSKSKEDLLSIVAVGSIWTTGPMITTATAIAASTPPPAKRTKTQKKAAPKQPQAKSKAIYASSKPAVSGPSSKSAPLRTIQFNHLEQVKPSASSKRVVGVKAKPRAPADGSKQSAKTTGGKCSAPQKVAPSKRNSLVFFCGVLI
ncbi:MAG: hypothetical protein SGBAC_009640 [Bacillariaceae sp.]